MGLYFFFQAEDGIRDAQESRGLGDVYKRQENSREFRMGVLLGQDRSPEDALAEIRHTVEGYHTCLLYTSDAADDLLCVDLGGRRIIKKKKTNNNT